MSEPYTTQKDVARIHRAFYDAIERADLEAMRAVWLDDERIQCVHPGWELLVGTARVHESWRAIFGNAQRLEFELSDLAIEILGELAWATCTERIRSSREGERFEASAVATNLFLRRDGEWRMLLHHASPILRQAQRESEA